MASTYSGKARNEFQYLPSEGIGQPGAATTGGGGGVPEPFFRDILDERRSMYRRVPSAEYPDGYLGTITSRRGDRVLNSLKARVNERSYVRGVHKGERIDPTDYFWPEEFTPDLGLQLEAQGKKFAPLGVMEPRPTMEQVMPARGALFSTTLGPQRQSQLRRLLPSWKW